MGINFNDIIKVINPEQKSDVIRLIIDYGELKQKLENPENNSWYFTQALESNKAKLISLEKNYEKIRVLFNESTIDTLINGVNKNLVIKSWYERHGMNTIQQMHYSSVVSQVKFLNELIRLKSKTVSLMSADYYLANPEELIKLID
ncbi:MAG TPA: hypothetical protein PLJ52_06170 [Tenuifilaceae bacterium]|nr:hypothetical protein [Tenuifilaceae bacterium]